MIYMNFEKTHMSLPFHTLRSTVNANELKVSKRETILVESYSELPLKKWLALEFTLWLTLPNKWPGV